MLVTAGSASADELLDTAVRESETVRDVATADAESLRAQAQDAREKARQEAERVLEAARAEAEKLRREVDEEIDGRLSKAQQPPIASSTTPQRRPPPAIVTPWPRSPSSRQASPATWRRPAARQRRSATRPRPSRTRCAVRPTPRPRRCSPPPPSRRPGPRGPSRSSWRAANADAERLRSDAHTEARTIVADVRAQVEELDQRHAARPPRPGWPKRRRRPRPSRPAAGSPWPPPRQRRNGGSPTRATALRGRSMRPISVPPRSSRERHDARKRPRAAQRRCGREWPSRWALPSARLSSPAARRARRL